MKAKKMMLGAVAMGAMVGQVGALEADAPKPATPEILPGVKLPDTVPGGPAAPCRGKSQKSGEVSPKCPDPPNGWTNRAHRRLSLDNPAVEGEKLAVKKTTKKIGFPPKKKSQKSRILEIEESLNANRVAVKKTTKKICAA